VAALSQTIFAQSLFTLALPWSIRSASHRYAGSAIDGARGTLKARSGARGLAEHSGSRYPAHGRFLACTIGRVAALDRRCTQSSRSEDNAGLCLLPNAATPGSIQRTGGKVLSLAAAQLRVAAPPKALPAEVVLRPAGPRSRHRHYFKRESLHELVWTAPVLEVAKRLGVSDVGLARLCRRAEIPTPGRGYWARVESGQRVGRAPLPPAPESLPELLRIRGTEPPPASKMSEAA
jgi:hypothetical protein